MIWLIPTEDEEEMPDVPDFSSPPMLRYRFRVVTILNRHLEKNSIFQNGFDNTIMEFLKQAVWKKTFKKRVYSQRIYSFRLLRSKKGSIVEYRYYYWKSIYEFIWYKWKAWRFS